MWLRPLCAALLQERRVQWAWGECTRSGDLSYKHSSAMSTLGHCENILTSLSLRFLKKVNKYTLTTLFIEMNWIWEMTVWDKAMPRILDDLHIRHISAEATAVPPCSLPTAPGWPTPAPAHKLIASWGNPIIRTQDHKRVQWGLSGDAKVTAVSQESVLVVSVMVEAGSAWILGMNGLWWAWCRPPCHLL